MADYAIHDTTLTGISNVIRKKDGTSALIDPADYADRINLMGMLEEKTVSGTIAHFDDGADAVPLKGLVVSIVPIGGKGTPQNPIAISGVDAVKITHTGKNLAEFSGHAESTYSGLTITANADGSITFSGTPSRTWAHLTTDFAVDLPVGTYTLGRGASASYAMYIAVKYEDNTTENISMATSASKTFTTSKRIVQIRLDIATLNQSTNYNETVLVQLEAGSSASDFEAYEEPTIYDVEFPNPNPNLRLTADVDDGMWTESGTINPSSGGGFGRAFTMAVSEKTTYDIYGLLDNLIVYLDSNKTMISYERLSNTALSLQDERKTTPANCAYIGLSALAFDVSSVSVKESFFVYVGQYDAISGTMTITHIMRTYNTADMDNNNEIYAGWRSANIRDILGTGLNQRFSNQTLSVGTDFSANTMGATNDLLMLPQSLYSLTQTEWQELALDVQICLPLLTPIVIQLDPIPIDSKEGTNNIWNDTSGDTDVTYRGQGTAYIYPEGEGVSF